MRIKRNVGLEAEMSEDRDSYEPAPATEPATEPATPAPVVAMPSVDMAALAQLLASAIQQGTAGAIEQTKPKVREIEDSGVSVFHPAGKGVERPALDSPTYIGVINEASPHLAPDALYDYDEDQCTDEEILALNRIPVGSHTVRMYDGVQEPVQVYLHKDLASGQTIRKIIALRKQCFDKGRRNSIPDMVSMARQMVPA